MRRLAVVSLVLVMILSLGMGAALLIGRGQPPSERVERLHLTDCTPPCWDGITPRLSTLKEVQQRIAATFPDFKHLSSINLPFQTWTVDDLAPNDTSIEVAVDDGSVYSVSIRTDAIDIIRERMPYLGDMLAVFGAPMCVSIEANTGNAVFTYENAADQVIWQLTTVQPSLYSPVKSIYVGGSQPFTCEQVLALSWLEFRRSPYAFQFTS